MENIEKWVQLRETIQAKKGIVRFLREQRNSPDALEQALEWYRRLGLYRDGYTLACRHLRQKDRFDPDSRDGRLALWICRYLYLLGATQLAVSLVQRIHTNQLSNAAELQFVAEVYLVVADFDRAIAHYRKAVSSQKAPLSREARICRLGLSDALVGARHFDEALKIVRKEKTLTQEPLPLAVILSCEGEYLARQEKFREALPILREAKRLLPPKDRTVDQAALAKWLGHTLIRLGKVTEGLACYDTAIDTFRALGIRDEVIFDVLLLKHQTHPLSDTEWTRIGHFPGLSPGLRKKVGTPPRWVIGPEKAPFLIDFSTNEYCMEGQWYFGMPAEIQLIGWLTIAGDWGLRTYRAISLLWPDEPLIFFKLERRLDQLLLRIRKEYGLEVTTHQHVITLSLRSLKRVSVICDRANPPRVLQQCKDPSAKDLIEFYAMKKSTAYTLLKEWREGGLL